MLKDLSLSNFQDILNATHRKNSGIQLAILTRSLHFVFEESSVRDLYCVTKITRRRRSTWSGTNPSPMVCSLHLSGKDPNYRRKTLHHLLCPSYLQTPFPPSNHPVPFLPSNPHNCFLWPSSAKSSHLIHIFMPTKDFNLLSGKSGVVQILVGIQSTPKASSPFLCLIVFFSSEMCHDTRRLLARLFCRGG